MKEVELRYSKITEKFPRELILLQGKGCFWKKCIYCDYFHDVSPTAYELNSSIIEKVTGNPGVLDVINSGSAMELDKKTLDMIIKIAHDKNIKELWFEVHWIYHKKLKEFANKFEGIKVKYRTGVETFNTSLRKSWNKGIPEFITPEKIAKYFKGVCLLVGTQGQDLDSIIADIKIACNYFEHVVISVFVKNSTSVLPDEELIKKFIEKVYPKIVNNPKIEVLINNTDLGVG